MTTKIVLRNLTVFTTFIILVISAFIIVFIWSDLKLPYWQTFQVNDVVAKSAIYFLPVCMVALIALSIVQLFDKHSRNVILIITCITLSFFAVTSSCISTILVNVFEGDHIYRGDIELDGQRFYVDSSWKPSVGSVYLSSFWLNACDVDGRNCHIVFEKKYRRIPRDEYKNMVVTLLPDPAAHTITLQINGETVYVHQMK